MDARLANIMRAIRQVAEDPGSKLNLTKEEEDMIISAERIIDKPCFEVKLTKEEQDKLGKGLQDSNLPQQERDKLLSQIINNSMRREFNIFERLIIYSQMYDAEISNSHDNLP